MSKSTNQQLAPTLVLTLFAVGMILATPPPRPPAEQTNPFMITQAILKAYYPEVFGQGWYLNVSTGEPIDDLRWANFVGFNFKVTRFSPGTSFNPTFDASTGKMAPEPQNTIFLEGRTWVDGEGLLISFLAAGDFARSQQNDAFRKLVESHPEWSEDMEIHALKEAGAKYGPADKDHFIKSLHLESAEKALGRLRIASTDFVLPNTEHVGSFAAGGFYWVVNAEAERSKGSHVKYSLTFEAFDGRLTIIHRTGAPVG